MSSLAWEGCSHHAAPAIKNDLIRSGFQTSAASTDDPKQHHVVIWSKHELVKEPLRLWLEQLQGGAGDNDWLQQAFIKQRSALSPFPHDDDADILRVARQVGADHAIIAEVTIISQGRWHQTHVAVRDFAVVTQTMQWSGMAHCARPMEDQGYPVNVVIALARIAVGIGMGRSADEPLLQQDLQICR